MAKIEDAQFNDAYKYVRGELSKYSEADQMIVQRAVNDMIEERGQDVKKPDKDFAKRVNGMTTSELQRRITHGDWEF